MSHPFILPANPTFGTQLAQQLSQGVNAGLEKGIAARLNGLLAQKKELGKVASNVNMMAKRYGKDAFDTTKLAELQQRTSQLVSEGKISAQDASLLAFLENDEKAALDKFEKENKTKKVLNALVEDQVDKPPERKINNSHTQIPLNFLNEPKPEGFWQRVLNGTGENVALQAHALEQQREAIPQSIYGGIEGSTLGAVKLSPPETEAGEIYRELFKYGGFAKTAGRVQGKIEKVIKPTGPAGKLSAGAITGATVSSAQQMINKGEIDPVQLGLETAVWTGLEGLFIVAPQIMRLFKKPIEDIAKKTGLTAEEVLQTAVNETKTDFEAVLNGDQKEINKLKDRLSKEASGGGKVKAAEKTTFNPKEAIKQREAHAEKLETSPFRENFEIENRKAKIESGKTPETRAKEAEVAKRVEPKIAQLEKQIDANRKDLAKLEDYSKKYIGQGKERVELNVSSKRKSIERQMEELKDLRYELKNGKPRPTEAQLEIDAENSAKKIVDQVKNPTPENLKSFEDQLAKDKRFLDRAEAIRKRGEFDKDFRVDEHIRLNEKYQKAYDAMVVKLKDEISSLKGARDAESLKKITENKEAINRLEQRQKRHKANITNQKEKIIALKSIEGPSGALYKNQIRRTQGDLAEFQKDFAQFKKSAETKAEIGTEHKGQKAIKESGKEFEKATKVGEEVGKNPTQENIAKAAEETGIPEEKIKQETQKMGEIIKENAEKIKSGTGSETSIQKAFKRLKRHLQLAPNLKAFGLHFGIGSLLGVIENETGYHLPRYIIYGPSSIVGEVVGLPRRTLGRQLGFPAGRELVYYMYEKSEASKLKSLRKNPAEYSKYLQSLRKRYGPTRINKMIEYSKS